MGLENRPYVGTWRLGQTELVQMTPDALVYINGATSLPGCPHCNGRIDIQKFITEVSVDAGVDPGAASASFTLSIPLHHSDSFARDAQFILRPGLEVNVYKRGYFPVKGLYQNLAEAQADPAIAQDAEMVEPPLPTEPERKNPATVVPPQQTNGVLTRQQVTEWAAELGVTEDHLVAAIVVHSEGFGQPLEEQKAISHTLFNRQATPGEFGDDIWTVANGSNSTTGAQRGSARPYSTERIPTGRNLTNSLDAVGSMLRERVAGSNSNGAVRFFHPKSQDLFRQKDPSRFRASQDVHRDWLAEGFQEVSTQFDREGIRFYAPNQPADLGKSASLARQALGMGRRAKDTGTGLKPVTSPAESPSELTEVGPSLLDQAGLGGLGIENVMAYPYYHVFHGVVIQVGHSYSGGVNTITVQCQSMLHFWQYQLMSTNAAVFGARPDNSRLQISEVGHNYTGMHPYEIIYMLHHDMAGSAGGVGWAISSKTNQTARTEFGGESLFSLNIRYWRQRFNARQIKLRLHGASGSLFSSAQAAFLARTSSHSLKALVRSRFKDPAGRRQHQNSILQQATSLGLMNQRRLAALLFARKTRPTGGQNTADFELNLTEMQAFVSDLGQWSAFNMFESAYESKLDIAQKVMQVTGFEFYQDVDGDFVFKPPMYNLDTSDSRVYRIEDIDIISLTTDEKEPQYTYATVKAGHFKNMVVSGLENEWGHRGQYIDYRLVAQFGWRPLDEETAYFADPKSMFFAAVNRLDIMNAPANGAQVTIPLRPELRPGYPVYIPYLDAYYYCTSFAHSFSVGGDCTTALQLIAKRSKFFAPGRPDVEGIDAIDLANTQLPQRPLEVLGDNGVPRLSGFPNVVMALDPTQINPLFWVVGTDIERLDDPVVLRNLLYTAYQADPDLVRPLPGSENVWVMSQATVLNASGEAEAQEVRFFFDESELSMPDPKKPGKKGANQPVGSLQGPEGTVSLLGAAREYVAKARAGGTALEGLRSKASTLQHQINTAEILLGEAKKDDQRRKLWESLHGPSGLYAQQRQAVEQIQQKQAEFEQTQRSETRTGVAYLVDMLRRLAEHHWVAQGRGDKREVETHRLLDMLSDKKAIFTNGKQPGAYRYYSASHPDPEHQGQMIVEYVRPPEGGPAKIQRKNPFLEPEYQGQTVSGFIRNLTMADPGAYKPEAQFGDVQPVWGIRVLTSNPRKKHGEVLPTSEIRELMFAVQDASVARDLVDSTADALIKGLADEALPNLTRRLLSTGETPTAKHSLKGFMFKTWSEIILELRRAVSAALYTAKKAGVYSLPDFGYPAFPKTVPYQKVTWDTEVELGATYEFKGGSGASSLGRGTSNKTLMWIMDTAGALVAQSFLDQFRDGAYQWLKDIVEELGRQNIRLAEQILTSLFSGFASALSIQQSASGRSRLVKRGKSDRIIESPVFPVSDARGYTVVGSYRYGRDVRIEPGGVWDSLAAQDPLSLLDRTMVEEVVDTFVRGKGVLVEVEKRLPGGTVVREKQRIHGPQAAREVEKKVLATLQKHLTNKQIIDLGLLVKSKRDPNMLELNLSNWFADGEKEGIHKLPVNNAAFSLADLTAQVPGHVCACKAAEATVMIEALGQADFLSFNQAGDSVPEGFGTGTADRATELMAAISLKGSAEWKASQDALRGRALDTGAGTTIIQNFQDLGEALTQGAGGKTARQTQAREAFDQAQENAAAALDKVEEIF